MKRFAVLVVVLLLFAAPAVADNCIQRARVVTHRAYPSYVQQYHYPVYNYVPVAVFEPIRAVYAVGGAVQSTSADGAELARALEKLTLAVNKLADKADGSQAQSQANGLQAKAIQIMGARCAKCHTGDTAKGGLRIFDAPGQMSSTLNALDVAAMMSAVKDGVMPPAPAQPLSDEEYLAIDVWGKPLVKAARKAAAKK